MFDMSNSIPEIEVFDFEKSLKIEQFLKSNPETCKNYLLRLLEQRNNRYIGRVEYLESKNCISIYIKEYKQSKFTTVVKGKRCFDIKKLSIFLSTTLFFSRYIKKI